MGQVAAGRRGTWVRRTRDGRMGEKMMGRTENGPGDLRDGDGSDRGRDGNGAKGEKLM